MRHQLNEDQRRRLARGGFDPEMGAPWGRGGFDPDLGPSWGPGRGRGRGRGPGRGRARRGDVRAAILALLGEKPMHGYEMIQVLEARTGGIWRPSPGSVYPALQLLEDEGLVTVGEEGGKRLYTLTEAGQAAGSQAPEGPAPWDVVTAGISPEVHSLRKLTGQVMMAVRQVAEAGDPDARTKAVEVLTETRKKLYGILAETD